MVKALPMQTQYLYILSTQTDATQTDLPPAENVSCINEVLNNNNKSRRNTNAQHVPSTHQIMTVQ